MKLVRCDADVPYSPCVDWTVNGLIEPGVRRWLWSGIAETPEDAVEVVRSHHFVGSDAHFPLIVCPNYVRTGRVSPVFVESWA